MSFLDKAREKASQLVDATKEKVDDLKDKRRADDLLDDLGRILYRQRTDRSEPDDETEIVRLVGELRALETEGTEILAPKAPAPLPPPTVGAPLPPPMPE